MKNQYLLLAMILLLGCGPKRSDLERANHERDSLYNLAIKQEGEINQFVAAFNEIENNLDSVSLRQQVISLDFGSRKRDLNVDQKERINSQIAAINTLMEQNRQKVEALRNKVGALSKKNKTLEGTLATLNKQLFHKEMELSELNKRLTGLDAQVTQLQTTVDTLVFQNIVQTMKLAENDKRLRTAYYIVGKTKELEQAQLIDKKGGLLGIGKTPVLKENLDKNKFVRIDYTTVKRIPVEGKDVKIITTHPADSYAMDKDKNEMVKELVIKDPEKFWSVSKYLVVAKK